MSGAAALIWRQLRSEALPVDSFHAALGLTRATGMHALRELQKRGYTAIVYGYIVVTQPTLRHVHTVACHHDEWPSLEAMDAHYKQVRKGG